LGEEQAGYGLLLEVHAEHTEGELSGMTTYRMYITTPNTNDIISAIYGDNESPMEIATSTSFYQHPFGSALGTNNNPLLYSGFPELEFDSWLTMGLDAPPGPGEVAPSTIGDLNNGWVSNFEAGMNIVIEDSIGGAMFVTNDPGTTNIVSGEEQRILIGQFTTDGDMSGVINAQMFTEGVTDPADRVTLEFDGVGLQLRRRHDRRRKLRVSRLPLRGMRWLMPLGCRRRRRVRLFGIPRMHGPRGMQLRSDLHGRRRQLLLR
jgi:hypothetical protein